MRNEQPQPQPQQPKRGRGQPSPIRDPEMRARHISLMAQIRMVRGKQRRSAAALAHLNAATTRASAKDPNDPRNDTREAAYLARMADDERRRHASLDAQLTRLQAELAAHDALIAEMQGKE